VSNERVSGAKPTTPEAIMAESDSKHDGNKRRAPRRGGAPWPPPGADTAWWTQDGGTHTAAPPTSTAPPERSAPGIPAPTTVSEAADSTTAAEPAADVSSPPVDSTVTETVPDDDVTEARTARVTRRRGRSATSPNDRPASSRRKKSVEAGPAGMEATEVADIQVVGEPAAADRPAETPADETPAHADNPAAIEPVDVDAIDGDEPAGIDPADDQDAADATEPAAVAEPAEPPDEEAVLDIGDEAIDQPLHEILLEARDDATTDAEPASRDAAFSVAATIVADGDFVEEPEFAVPDIAAPPSTRRNAPETGFPLRAAPSIRPPARREPVLAAAPPSPVRRWTATALVPVQVSAHGDSLDDFEFFSGEAGQVPAAFAPVRRPQPIRTGRPHRHRKARRRPAFGLPALLIFALAAAFFAWVSATPLLLTAGHGKRGVATVATCSVHGIDRSCAEFVAADRSFSAAVTLLGPASTHASAGQKLDAQMVSRDSSLAYAGNSTDLLLHWIPGVVLLVLCGFGIAWATGALRLVGGRIRSLALLGSFGGPILLFAGMLAYAW
jgi:hypothetical protein